MRETTLRKGLIKITLEDESLLPVKSCINYTLHVKDLAGCSLLLH